MIIAVDFDGTIVEHQFPGIGPPLKILGRKILMIDFLKEQKTFGTQIILWTCRGGESLQKAMDWCAEQGLEFDAVNEDVEGIKLSDFGGEKSCKVFADVYVDDRNSLLDLSMFFSEIYDLSAPIVYLNDKTGSNFKPNNKASHRLISARYAEGRTLADFQKVIDNKAADWLGDPEMEKFLRPETLFAAKHFESYLNEPAKLSRDDQRKVVGEGSNFDGIEEQH